MSKRTESTDEVNIGLVRLLSKLISYRGARWPKVPIHDDKSDAGIALQIRFGRWQRGVHDRMPPSPADRPKNLAYLLLGAIVSLIINDDGNPLEQALLHSGHYASSLTNDTTQLEPRRKPHGRASCKQSVAPYGQNSAV